MYSVKKLAPMAAAAALLAVCSVSYGGELGAKISTLGLGLEYTHPINDKFDVSIGYNQYDFSDTLTESNVTYNADLEWSSIALLGNWRPRGGKFHITAGFLLNSNEIKARATTTGSYDFGGQTFAVNDVASAVGTLDFKSIAPYIGIGRSGNIPNKKNMTFSFDLGVAFQGKPSVALSGTCSPAGITADSTCQSRLNAALAVEAQEFRDDIDGFSTYPVLSVGIGYVF